MTTFAELELAPDLLQAIHDVGYEEPSPIQEQAIPPLLHGADVIGQAQTGSGKTAAFGLPMLQYVDPSEPEVQGLVLTPTRELCIQVTQALRAYGKRKGVDVVAVFGGAPIRTQQAQLRAGGHIVVGTVGRVKDLISRHSLMLHSCRFVVLDEADEMLDLGFLEDVERILSLTPSSRQTALFSATMPPEIRRLADQYLYDPVTVKVKAATLTVDTVEQFALEVKPREKADRLVEVLQAERPEQAIVFVRTKIRCEQLFRTLRDRGMNVKALHGDMTQGARDGVMISFKDGRLPLLVATDVAARGLDIAGVSHIAGCVRSPDWADRARRPQRPGDHVLRAAPEARHPGDRAPRRGEAGALGRARPRRTDRGNGQAAAPLQASRDGQRRRRREEADRFGRPSGRTRAVRHHPRDHGRHRPRRRGRPQRSRARTVHVPRGA
jgi:ATP-dependent RNA helicase DeaD